MADLVNGLGGAAGFGEDSMGRGNIHLDPVLIDLSTVFPGGLTIKGTTFSSLELSIDAVAFWTGGLFPAAAIAPFLSTDVDTRFEPEDWLPSPGGTSRGSNLIWWDLDAASRTFTVTWDDVSNLNAKNGPQNAYQLQIVAVGSEGEFDIHFRYETVQWLKGFDFTDRNASAVYWLGAGSQNFFSLPQSGTTAMSTLPGASNIGEPGHFVFEVRNTTLFTAGAETVDFNNLTADQKTAIADGSNLYNGLGGADTVILPSPENYNQVVGSANGADIKLGWTSTSASTFHTGSLVGDQYSVQAGEGDHFIVTGVGDDTVDIFGSGNNKIVVGGGNATILIDVATTNGNNTIVGGAGNETITLRSSATTDGSGTQDIRVGAGSTRLTVEGRFFTTIHGGANDASRATFDLISIDDRGGNSPISLDGFSNATSVLIESSSSLLLKPGSFLKADVIRNTDGKFIDPGSIIVDADATLEIGTKFTGTATLGSGSSTLILDDAGGVAFTPDQTVLANLSSTFSISNIGFGDSIVLRGVNVPTNPVVSATMGEAMLKDGGTQLALQIQTEAELHVVAIDAVNGSAVWDNKAYFKVAESGNGQDTVLTLVAGNNFADSMGAAAARQKYGLDGTGIRVGIISDSFANDAAAYQRDVQLGILPAVTILSDNLAGYVLAGGIDEGRAMAQIIHAVAPGASLYFSALGSAGGFGFAGAVRDLVAAGCDIIVDDVDLGRALEFIDPTVAHEINSAIDLGVTFVTAAGNDRERGISVYGHAALERVISVGAANVLAAPSAAFPNGQYLPADTEPTSSQGANGKPDLSGPTRGQTSLPLVNEGLNPFPGTSAAAPAVAGLAALMMQYNPLLSATPRLVETLLEQASFPFGQPSTAGAGFVQADTAVGFAYRMSPAFFVAPSPAPFAAGFASPEGLTAAPVARLESATLSTGPGNASRDQRVLILLTLDQAVSVSGASNLTLDTGRVATYDAELSTPAAGRLLFQFTVGAAEQTADLRVTGVTGTIKDGAGADVDLSPLIGAPTGLTINSPLKVLAVTSTHSGVATVGETIEVMMTLSSGVTLDSGGGAPTLALSHGATALLDLASSDLAAGKLVFDYQVGAGEATADLSLASIELPLGSWLRDASGNSADLSLTLDESTGVQVGPTFVTNAFPAFEQTALATGQTVDLTIVLSRDIIVDLTKGSPTLTLGNGAVAAFDLAASDVSKGALVFAYTARVADLATDNLMITGLALNGATIRDANGLDVDLSGAHGVATALTIHSPLTVQSFVASKAGEIKIGDGIQLTIVMEDSLQVIGNASSGGPPTLSLNDGGVAFYNALDSDLAAGRLVFDYLVESSARATADLAIAGFNRNGAILVDDQGNFADMSGALDVPTGVRVTAPLRVSIAALEASRVEGNVGAIGFAFMITLDQAATTAETVGWAVTGAGAHAATAADFAGGVLPSSAVTFAFGEMSKTITVAVQGDSIVEGSEAFVVTLASPSPGLAIETAAAGGTIVDDDATVSVAAATATAAEGQSGTTVLAFTLTRSGDLASVHGVSWSVAGSDGNAASAGDFAAGALPSGSVTFQVGETTKTIAIEVAGDTAVEADETFTLSLSSPTSGLTVVGVPAGGTILNDDAVTSVLATNAAKAEGNGGATGFNFTVTRAGDIAVAHSVSWSVTRSGSDPADESDFVGGVFPTGSVTFAAGEVAVIVTVSVAGDSTVEAGETFTITLSAPSTGLAIGTASAVGSIGNDDATVSIAVIGSAAKPEGNAGSTPFAFVLSRTGDSSTAHSVGWAVTGSSATPADADDFADGVPSSGTVTFAAGETSRTLIVDVEGDSAIEADDGFAVALSAPSPGLTIVTATAAATIVNDDARISIAVTGAAKVEGNAGSTAYTFALSRSGDLSVSHSVAWGVAGSGTNSATASDFVGNAMPSGSVTFAASETSRVVTVSVQGDTAAETDEGFTVSLMSPSAGATIGTAAATGTIQNDDVAVLEAYDDAYVGHQGKAVVAAAGSGLLFNDAGATAASIVTGPDHGTLQLAGNGGFIYTPAAGFTGIDAFTYQASNGSGGTGTAEAVVHVAPVLVGATTTLDLLALTAEEQIAATYAAFFGRAADAAGFVFWVGEFNAGLPVHGAAALFANIASSFGIGAEARALYPFLADPSAAGDDEIGAFLQSVYNNLFNRGSDPAGLAYWTGQIKQTLQAGQFVGSVLVNIMGGAQDSAAGQDITTLMGKVAVSLEYVQEQIDRGMGWAGDSDRIAATSLLQAVTSAPQTVLTGIRTAEDLVAAHP